MSTNKCCSVEAGAITELDTRKASKRDWYLNLGAHESFTEEELFKLKIQVDVSQLDTAWGRVF